jgi:hypothetical protein
MAHLLDGLPIKNGYLPISKGCWNFGRSCDRIHLPSGNLK